MPHVFDLSSQHADLDAKIVAGLERIGRALALELGERARKEGLSSIQAHIILFLKHHPESERRVGLLARHFDLTHATVSDAVSALKAKGFVARRPLDEDRRVVVLSLTDAGRKLAASLEGWADHVRDLVSRLDPQDKPGAFRFIENVIALLQEAGLITVARMCRTCRHFRPDVRPGPAPHHCALLEKPLADSELRLDCPEYRAASSRSGS